MARETLSDHQIMQLLNLLSNLEPLESGLTEEEIDTLVNSLTCFKVARDVHECKNALDYVSRTDNVALREVSLVACGMSFDFLATHDFVEVLKNALDVLHEDICG